MPHAVFVAPVLLETTLRFVRAAGELPGVGLSLITQDGRPLTPELRRALACVRRVPDALDPAAILEAIGQLPAELGPPARVVGALEQLQVPLAEVRERLGVPGLSVEAARNFRDKARMKQVLRRAGVPCARFGVAPDVEAARRLAVEIGFPVVIKPPGGAGARNTFRVDGPNRLDEILRFTPLTPAQPMMIEEFIVGDEHSFDTISIEGRPVWHSLTRYLPGPLEVKENPWIQWCVVLPREVDHPRYDAIRAAGFRALEALGMDTGLSHMEWFRRRDGSVAINEVGARPPGAQFTTLMSYAHDIDFYRAWGKLMIFGTFDPPPRAYAAGIAFLRGQGRGRVREIHGLEQAQRELGELVVEARLPRPGQMPEDGYEGEGWVVLRHPRTDTVVDALRRLVQVVRVELG